MIHVPVIRKSGNPEVRKSDYPDIAVIIRAALETIKQQDFRTSGRTRTP